MKGLIVVGADVDEEGVDLDEFAGRLGFSALGQTLCIALVGIEAEAPAAGPAPQDRHGNDDASVHQSLQDAPDLGDADGPPLAVEERRDLALAPHRVVGADGHFGRRTRWGRREPGSGAFSHR